MASIVQRLAQELAVGIGQVEAAVGLLDEQATVPFIARYRKEATGGLDDVQLRRLVDRLGYLRDLEQRRAVILESIEEQGKLTTELREAITQAESKARLEDLYTPYRPRRRSRARAAREAGLDGLVTALLADPLLGPEQAAQSYVDAEKGVADVAAALDGARAILVERLAEDADLVGALRQLVWARGVLRSSVVEGKEDKRKFADYFDARVPLKRVPSHRALALFRGRREGVLRLSVQLPDASAGPSVDSERRSEAERRIAESAGIGDEGRPADSWLLDSVRVAWKARLLPQLASEAERTVRERAEAEAIGVFGRNLHDLLLAAPAGTRITMGLDPGIRTGVKVAVVDQTGKLLETTAVFPHPPREDRAGAISELGYLCARHHVELIAIGNGTGSRETDKVVAELMARRPDLGLTKVTVSEAGASVYSASELGSQEFPDLDVSLRGAVSIARRLQDPLAELVRIEPKAIGVGQYQHDVNQGQLVRQLHAVVEDCVNAVGADVNTASVPLLTRISGLNRALAENIVAFRDGRGPFRDRAQLRAVPRMGPRAFQQAAGFLRITDGDNPLDASAVHPEAYPVVDTIVRQTGLPVSQLVGQSELLRGLSPEAFASETFGTPTVQDILTELEKPGRDPRPEFRTATFTDGVEHVADLKVGMTLEGVVTNVAAFGAFVDVGVHQDGLVHISQLADRFVSDPHVVVKAGDIVTVRVTEVDEARGRISLSMRPPQAPDASRRARAAAPAASSPPRRRRRPDQGPVRVASKVPGRSERAASASGQPAPRSNGRKPPAGGGAGHKPDPRPPTTALAVAFAKLRERS